MKLVERFMPPWSRPLANTLLALNGFALMLASWTPGPYVVRSHVMSGQVEHFIAYFLSGLLVSAAMSDRLSPWRVTIILVTYAGILELGQLFVPGRHAAFSDFATSGLGAVAGVVCYLLVSRRFLATKPRG
jgi:VanZ family protein